MAGTGRLVDWSRVGIRLVVLLSLGSMGFVANTRPAVNGWRGRLMMFRRDFDLRIAELEDVEKVVAVAHAEFAKEYDTNLEKMALRVLLWLGFYLRLRNVDDHKIILYAARGDIKGMGALSVQPTGRPAPAVPTPRWLKSLFGGPLLPYISNLLVTSDFRRRGLGRALVRRCERLAAEDSDSISLHFDADNFRLRQFYRRLGYQTFLTINKRTQLTTSNSQRPAVIHFNGLNLTYAEKVLPSPRSSSR